jgi:hypothetical protein
MSPRRTPRADPHDSDRTDDDRPGYGRPPKQHQFKPGQSGNPRGRRKGRKTNATLLREILDRKIPIRVEGKIRKLSIREVMLTRFAEAGLKGDIKSAAYLLQRDDLMEAGQQPSNEPSNADEQQIIDAYLRNYLKKKDPDI